MEQKHKIDATQMKNTHKNKPNKISNKDEKIQYDDLLSAAGEIGLYQVLLFFFTFPFYVFGGFAYFSQLFITEVSPNHWCWIPELENLTDIRRRRLAIPPDENSRFGYSRCEAYVANWTQVLANDDIANYTWTTQPCRNGWEFNRTEIPYPTISSELGWVCDKATYQANAQTIFFLGSVIGGIFIGWIADRFGRLPALVLSNLIGCVGGAASAFSKSFLQFSVCRFLMGMSSDNCTMMAYLIALEYVVPKYRSLVASLSYALFYAPTLISLPWIALACDHWKTTALVTSLPMALSLLAPLVVPESPRWLLSKGRVDDAVNKVLSIAKINRKYIPPELIQKFKTTVCVEKKEDKQSIFELIKKPLLGKMFFYASLVFMCVSLVFDALVRTIGQLEFDFFVSFSVISFTEFPSLVVSAFVLDWLGRRWVISTAMIMSCIFCILTAFAGGGLPSVICAVMARFVLNMAFGGINQWSAEVLPTSVRGTGSSVIHILGNLFTMLSPHIVYLQAYAYWLPLVLVGCVSGVSSIITLLLPEIAKKDMPQTFDDAEELVRSQKFLEMPCLKNEVIL